MKLGTIGYVALAAVVGSVAVSASSRQPAGTPARPATAAVQPAGTPAQTDNLKNVLATFRSDLNVTKVRTLNQVMKLNSGEAATFWPIYQKYEKELAALADRRLELIKQFVTLSNEGKLTNENAGGEAEKWLKAEQDRLDLWKKYTAEIGKAVSPIRGAQFLQVEHQIALLVDINIASEMPTVGQGK